MLDIIKYLEENDFIINELSIGPASPIIITKQIPYSNVTYDFSKLNDGEYKYKPREIRITCTWGSDSKLAMYDIYSIIITKLLAIDNVKIKNENIYGYYIGKVIEYSEIEDFVYAGKMTITLRCEPFKIAENNFGDDIWDDFRFNIDDVVENNVFQVVPGTIINVKNNGRAIVPEVVCDAEMQLLLNDRLYRFNSETTKNSSFKLSNGENIITVTEGTGTITINFKEEYL